MQNPEIDQINKYLATQGNYITGQTLYRIVWSDDEYEFRKGEFNEFTEAGLLIRSYSGVRKVRKYNYILCKWIFEKWAPGELTKCDDIPSSENGDYIPVYVFQDKNKHPLDVNMKVINFLLAVMRGQVPKDDWPSQEYIEEQEEKSFLDQIDNHPMFSTGSGKSAVGYTKCQKVQ